MTQKGAIARLARPCARIAVRVTPGASRDAVEPEGAALAIRTTAPPEGGRTNAAGQELPARTLGAPKSRLTLIRGARSRDKLFRLD